MRTTVEITDEHRAKLLHEAARHAEAQRLLGTLSDVETDRIEEEIRALRRIWRAADLVGSVRGGPSELSERTGQRFRELLEKLRRS